jgi:hypothetical protein
MPLLRLFSQALANDILVEQHNVANCEVADVTYKRHVVVINIGHSTTWETKKEGRFQRFFKARGAISFFPSDQPFSGRLTVESGVFANILFLALEFDTDRIELVRQAGQGIRQKGGADILT